jgi:hypothetical protein
VLREADDWQMCQVEAYAEGDKFSVVFGDETKATASVSQFPFTNYINHYRKEQPSTSQNFTAMLLQDMFDEGAPTANQKMSRHPALCNLEIDPVDWTFDSVIRSSMISPLRAPTPPPLPESTDKTPRTSRSTNSTPSRTPKRKRDTPTRKALPRTWSANEDKQLMQLVDSGPNPTKWSDLAHLMMERSGKQCRERYLNHLKPKLRFEEWTPKEDVKLCELYQNMGSKWAIMAKVIKGRTDNGIKNRFHHIRRRLDKDVARIVKTRKIDEVASLICIDAISHTPLRSETNSEFAIRARQILPYLAADSVKENVNRGQFGPFVPAKGDMCQRCNLIVPSLQTGRLVSKKTGWCESCTKIPPYIVGDMLRQCLHLRKEKA